MLKTLKPITPSDLKVGTSIYVNECKNIYHYIVKSSIIEENGMEHILVENVGVFEDDFYEYLVTPRQSKLFLGDIGLQGYHYDNRPCRAFINLEEAQAWTKLWNLSGVNPNFLKAKDGITIIPFKLMKEYQ